MENPLPEPPSSGRRRKLNPPEPKGVDEEPEAPQQPTKAQRLDAERDALALDVQEKATRIDELEDEVRFHEGNMNEQEHERHKAFTAVRAELSTALSQNNEHMVKANEDARSLRYWKREAKKPCRNCGTEWEFTND